MVKALHSTGNGVQRGAIVQNRTGTRLQTDTNSVHIGDGIEILEEGGAAGQHEDGETKQDEVNLIEQYQAKWPWWNDLHSIWSQRPNFNPIGIENAGKGGNHVEEFHQLLDDTQLAEDSPIQNENQEPRLSQKSVSCEAHDGYQRERVGTLAC